MQTATRTRRWQRVKRGSHTHMIPADDVIKHEASLKCGCQPDAEKAPQGWVVFHQRVS